MRRVESSLRHVAVLCAVPFMLSGCETMSKQQVGTGIGAVVGGALGNQVGSGSGRKVATVVGALAGGIIGNQIGRYLDEREKEQLADATYKTLDTGKPQTIKTKAGTTITTERVSTPAPTTSPPAATPAAGKTQRQTSDTSRTQASPNSSPTVAATDCGSVKQTIVTSDNQRYEDTVNACKKGGTWVVT